VSAGPGQPAAPTDSDDLFSWSGPHLPPPGSVTDPVLQSPQTQARDIDAALVAQLRPRPLPNGSRPLSSTERRASGSEYDHRHDSHATPVARHASNSNYERKIGERVRPDRSHSSLSRRPDALSDMDHLRQENAELRRHLSGAPTSKSRSGHRDSDNQHFAGAADEPAVPAFTPAANLASFSAPDSDASDPDVSSSFEQALTSHHHDEYQPPWLASDVYPMPWAHNMPHCADFVDPQRESNPLLLTFWDG
jgi:hypothetical protein